jgi:hypothetical protein
MNWRGQVAGVLFIPILIAAAGWYWHTTSCPQPTKELAAGWTVKELRPCPDNDPLGLFMDADCDPVKPKRKLALKEMTSCTAEQFYTDPRQCK